VHIFYLKISSNKNMSNKGIGSKKQHGFHKINERRAKSTLSARRNKAIARAKREKLREKGLQC
jgi:hypothetical protein